MYCMNFKLEQKKYNEIAFAWYSLLQKGRVVYSCKAHLGLQCPVTVSEGPVRPTFAQVFRFRIFARDYVGGFLLNIASEVKSLPAIYNLF